MKNGVVCFPKQIGGRRRKGVAIGVWETIRKQPTPVEFEVMDEFSYVRRLSHVRQRWHINQPTGLANGEHSRTRFRTLSSPKYSMHCLARNGRIPDGNDSNIAWKRFGIYPRIKYDAKLSRNGTTFVKSENFLDQINGNSFGFMPVAGMLSRFTMPQGPSDATQRVVKYQRRQPRSFFPFVAAFCFCPFCLCWPSPLAPQCSLSWLWWSSSS